MILVYIYIYIYIKEKPQKIFNDPSILVKECRHKLRTHFLDDGCERQIAP